jgi:hypothetical protein
MKELKWFRVNKPIPDDATYIKSDHKRENFREYVCDCHPMMSCSCPTQQWDVVEYHLYEIKK